MGEISNGLVCAIPYMARTVLVQRQIALCLGIIVLTIEQDVMGIRPWFGVGKLNRRGIGIS